MAHTEEISAFFNREAAQANDAEQSVDQLKEPEGIDINGLARLDKMALLNLIRDQFKGVAELQDKNKAFKGEAQEKRLELEHVCGAGKVLEQ